MGDSGEGLVDAESRIQERIEELQKTREQTRELDTLNPEQIRKLESLKLARTELSHQLERASHPTRKNQLATAIADVERRISEIEMEVR
jgi:hypothetical protein